MKALLFNYDDPWARYAVHAAAMLRKHSPSVQVNLIGQAPGDMPAVLTWPLEPYLDSVRQFSHVYRRLPGRHRTLDERCFLRWLIMAKWLDVAGVTDEPLWIQDSDVLVFCDVEKLHRDQFPTCDFTIPIPQSFWKPSALRAFAKEIWASLDASGTDHPVRRRLTDRLNAREIGHISDLAFSYAWQPQGLHQECTYQGWTICLDDNLGCDHGGYDVINGIKRIDFQDGKPFGYRQGKPQQLGSLHFWGTTRPALPKVADLALCNRLPHTLQELLT